MSQNLIPQDFIDRLVSSVPLVDYLKDEYSVSFKKSGKSYVAQCPLPNHQDNTPSFNVDPVKNVCNCFGCGGGGNVINVTMELSNMTFPEAVKKVASYARLEVPGEERRQDNRTPYLFEMNRQAAQLFQDNLKNTANPAIAILKNRDVSQDTIRQFMLGGANNSWNDITEHFGGYQRARLLSDAGLAVYEPKQEGQKAKLYDRFRNGLIFPIRNQSGNIVSFAVRHPDGTKPKYMNGAETPIFKKSQVLYGLYEALQVNRSPDMVIVSEGYFDVITAQSAGFPTVSPMGTAISSDQLRLLNRYTSNVVFCFDGDKAGQTASLRTLMTALPHVEDGKEFRFCFLPSQHDPDSMIREEGVQAFDKALSEAKPLSQVLLETVLSTCDLGVRESIAKAAKELVAMLNEMPDSLLKQNIISQFESATDFQITQKQQLSIRANDMPPQQLADLSLKVKAFVADLCGRDTDITVAFEGGQHEVPTGSFINRKSVIGQALEPGSSDQEKIALLNRAIEQVLINTGIHFKPPQLGGFSVAQVLSDAVMAPNNPTEKRLAALSIASLRSLMGEVDFSALWKSMADETQRITRLVRSLSNTVAEPDRLAATAEQFSRMLDQNMRRMELLSKLAPTAVERQKCLDALSDIRRANGALIEHVDRTSPQRPQHTASSPHL